MSNGGKEPSACPRLKVESGMRSRAKERSGRIIMCKSGRTTGRGAILLLTAGVIATMSFVWRACSVQADSHRNYDRGSFMGEWSAQSAVITNHGYPGRQVRISVPRYGKITCRINSEGTFALDVSLDRDLILDEGQTWLSNDRVLVRGGRKVFTTGRYTIRDSTADFYNVNRSQHFQSVLYTRGGHFFITYTDSARNEWHLECERTN